MSKPQDTSGLDPATASKAQPLFSIPEHEMIRRVGGGGGGEVWLARNKLGIFRAVKIVRVQQAGGQEAFRSEFSGVLKFEPISRLHDGLVDILQAGGGEAEGYFYYVMELADNVTAGQYIMADTYVPRTLSHDMRTRGRLPLGECVRSGAAIASALGFLHRQKLIHRDLKPSNIIFISGFPKLADVGLVAAMSGQNVYVGTEGFIAPEGAGSARADIYSLGKILYEMSTGSPAQEYPALPADLGASREDRDLAQFIRIVMQACRTDPQERFRSTDEFMMALLSFQFNRRISRWSTGRPLTWLIGILGAIIGGGFLIFLIWRLVWLLRHND